MEQLLHHSQVCLLPGICCGLSVLTILVLSLVMPLVQVEHSTASSSFNKEIQPSSLSLLPFFLFLTVFRCCLLHFFSLFLLALQLSPEKLWITVIRRLLCYQHPLYKQLTVAAFILLQKSGFLSFLPVNADTPGWSCSGEWRIDREALNYYLRLGRLEVVKVVVFCWIGEQ